MDANMLIHSDDYITIKSAGEFQFILPIWTETQPKFSFLPKLLKLAVKSNSRLIILFDCLDDWSEEFYKTKADLTVGDVSLDVSIQAEITDDSGSVVLSWLVTGDGSTPGKTVSELLAASNVSNPGLHFDYRPYGHFCGLLRISSWKRNGEFPIQRVWNSIWTMYQR